MDHFSDAKDLISESKTTFSEIEKAYKDSLHDKTIKPTLLIKIKNFMENLRSALDYTAHGLFSKYGDSNFTGNIYFPYAWQELNRTEFRSQNIINQKIPGISVHRPDVVIKLEGYQHFASPSNSWLPKFMSLNNDNKHQKLTPQTRKETKELRVSSGSVGLSLRGGATIKMSGNAQMRIGNAVVSGDHYFTSNNPIPFQGDAKQEIITWVSFHFSTNNEQVLPLLSQALKGVDTMVTELSAM